MDPEVKEVRLALRRPRRIAMQFACLKRYGKQSMDRGGNPAESMTEREQCIGTDGEACGNKNEIGGHS